MKNIIIPAEKWEIVAESNSCINASEQKGNKPVSVKTFEYGGFIYTSFATVYGAYGNTFKPAVHAWKLLPVALYKGDTTLIYHDEEAIQSGLRSRGDSTGLIVSVTGKLSVCAEPLDFLKEIPGTRPLSLAEAKSFNDSVYGGWRSLWYEGVMPEWFYLQAHPVAKYENKQRGCSVAILFWRNKGKINEMSISGEVELELSASSTLPISASLVEKPGRQYEQLSFF